MSTLLDLQTAWETTLDGDGWTRVPSSDYRNDLDRLTVGTQYYQIRGEVDSRDVGADSNTGYWRVNVEIAFLILVGLGLERNYLDAGGGAPTTDHWTLATSYMSPLTWEALSEVYQVVGGPEIEDSIERDGNLVTWSFKTQVLLAP